MADMIEFVSAVLMAVCDFLVTPPVFYLVGLICFCFICKAIRILMFR